MFRHIALVMIFALTFAASGPGQGPEIIDGLIRKLGADKVETREAASKRLEKIGAPALPALREAAKTDTDAEVRLRAGRLVKIITKSIRAAGRTFTGHTDQVTYAIFSPDGQRILSTGDDHSVRLWDVETGKQIRKFAGHESMVICCLFTRDGKRAVSCCGWPPDSTDRSIRVWNIETGKELRSGRASSSTAR